MSSAKKSPWYFAAAAIPILLWVWFVSISPRPYYVTEMDLEQDYYYNSQVLLRTGEMASVHHPGAPVYVLGAVLLATGGSDLKSTQSFFNYGYAVIALVSSISILLFCLLSGQNAPAPFVLLGVALATSWPTFLAYSNFFGADSFLIGLGLVATGCFWRSLAGEAWLRRRMLLGAGIAVGAALATKMSVVPVFVAMTAAVACFHFDPVWRAINQSGRRRIVQMPLTVFLGGVALAYLCATIPIWARIPRVWLSSFSRKDALPPDTFLLAAFAETASLIARTSPVLALVVAVSAVLALVSVAVLLRDMRRGKRAPDRNSFSFVPGAVFAALIVLALIYTAAAAIVVTPGAEPGVRLRNITPTIAAMPFLILFAWRFWSPRMSVSGLNRWNRWAAIAAVATLTVGLPLHFEARTRRIGEHEQRIAATRQQADSLRQTGARVAFWTESAQDFLGDVSFHFWGNYRYAGERFDAMLLDEFPGYTMLRLRTIRRHHEAPPAGSGARSESRLGALGDVYWKVKAVLLGPPEVRFSDDRIASGEDSSFEIGAVMVPRSEIAELRSISEADFKDLIGQRTRASVAVDTSIAGVPWMVIRNAASSVKAN